MIKKVLIGALISFSCSPAVAGSLPTSSSANNAQNTQSNTGTVNLNPMGGSNSNYQINSVSNSQHSFGPGIQCPTPELGISAFGGNDSAYGGGYTNGANNFGAAIMFTTPIGGDIGKACKELAQEIAEQRQLDTKITMIKQCAEFVRQGIVIDTTVFPEFKVCSAVTVNP